MNAFPRTFVPILLLSLVALACGTGPGATGSPTPGGAPTPTPAPTTGPTPTSTPPAPSPTSSPTPVGTLTVRSAAHAAALVFASDPRWAQMVPLRPDLIGASMWYEALEEVDGFAVIVTAGSGDCQSGCIDRHNWNYHVDYDGTVTLVSEDGDAVDVRPIGGLDGPASVTVHLVAGPTCPVEQVPPDPNCAPRSVVNAEVVIYDASVAEVGRGTSDGDGIVAFELAAGAYYVEAQPAEGLMGTPQAQAFSVAGNGRADLLMGYDTGIR